MTKTETIWHDLLQSAIAEKKFKFTQQEIAGRLICSLSTVNHALGVPSQMGAVRKSSKFFILADFEKLLYYWASLRRLEKDLVYQTSVEGSVSQIEGLVPDNCLYAAYSAARKILGESPADYNKVYLYADQEGLAEIKKRFPPPPRPHLSANLFVLKMIPEMRRYGAITTLPQTFVDLWNLTDWYARDFVKAIAERIKSYGVLS